MNSFGSLILFGFGGLFLLLGMILGVVLFTAASTETSLTVFLFGLGAVLIGAGLIYLGVVVRSRSQIRRFEIEARSEDLHGYSPKINQSGSINDVAYTYVYQPLFREGKTTTPPSLTIEMPVDSEEEFEIVRESGFDRFFKRIGIAKEVHTGDRNFDDYLYIRSDYPELIRTLFLDVGRRVAAKSLIETGFNYVQLSDKKLIARWNGFSLRMAPRKHWCPTWQKNCFCFEKDYQHPLPQRIASHVIRRNCD